jgi:hypothetical protein
MNEGQSQQEPGWVFKPGDQSQPTPAEDTATPPAQVEAPSSQPASSRPDVGHVEWTASEYLANPKSTGWFSLLAICSVLLATIVWILTDGDIVSTVVIALVGIIVGVFAARQPHTLNYKIDNNGLTIGEKFYPYDNFKSFSVANDQAIGYISLMPLKRFMPTLVVHYAPEDEDRIAQTLAEYLPYEDHKPDAIDNFARRIRF